MEGPVFLLVEKGIVFFSAAGSQKKSGGPVKSGGHISAVFFQGTYNGSAVIRDVLSDCLFK